MCGTMYLCIDQTILICRAACNMDLRAVQPISFPFVSAIRGIHFNEKHYPSKRFSNGFGFPRHLKGLLLKSLSHRLQDFILNASPQKILCIKKRLG